MEILTFRTSILFNYAILKIHGIVFRFDFSRPLNIRLTVFLFTDLMLKIIQEILCLQYFAGSIKIRDRAQSDLL